MQNVNLTLLRKPYTEKEKNTKDIKDSFNIIRKLELLKIQLINRIYIINKITKSVTNNDHI